MGEYSILYENNLAFSVSLDVFAKVSCEFIEKNTFEIEIEAGDFKIDENFKSFSISILNRLYLDFKTPRYARFKIDSKDFFFNSGRKKGLGSSASVFVGILKAFFSLYNIDLTGIKNSYLKKFYIDISGGFASAYDVLTSYYDYGFSKIIQGQNPKIDKMNFPFDFQMWLFLGKSSVNSRSSSKIFMENINKLPENFFSKSNFLIKSVLNSKNFDEFLLFLNEIKTHYKSLVKLGIDNDISLYSNKLDRVFYKSIGAGSEIGILIFEKKNKEALDFSKKYCFMEIKFG